jgi:hypothetical protein
MLGHGRLLIEQLSGNGKYPFKKEQSRFDSVLFHLLNNLNYRMIF